MDKQVESSQPGQPSARQNSYRLLQAVFRILLGAFLCFAGIGHLTVARTEFLAQVPAWLPLNADLVVVLSGLVASRLLMIVAVPGDAGGSGPLRAGSGGADLAETHPDRVGVPITSLTVGCAASTR